MSINMEFLEALYRRKHEHSNFIHYAKAQVESSKRKIAKAKTERSKKFAQNDLDQWQKATEFADDRLVHINALIPEYVRLHENKGAA